MLFRSALLNTVQDDYVFEDELLSQIDYQRRRVVLLTTHRRENLGEPMRHVYQALRQIVEEFPDVEVVFPVHRNPKVREVVSQELGGIARVHLIDPLEYQPFANLMARSYLVLTDSGGIQEEATAIKKPILIMRDTTERPEAVETGAVKLVGTNYDLIVNEVSDLLTNTSEYRLIENRESPYGDGTAAERIVAILTEIF